MKRFFAIMVVSLTPLITVCGRDLSYAEIDTLPIPRLAERMLGEAGKLMMDAERPRALPGQIKFFSYAFVPGSQYGICASEWTTLYVEKNGNIESIAGERRYGIEGSIYAEPGAWNYKQFASMCKAVKSTRSYFPAPDPQAALTIVAYIDALAGRGPSGDVRYEFDCSGACTDDARDSLKRITPDTISEATVIDCDQVGPYQACYRLLLKGQPVADYPREVRIYGLVRRPSMVEIRRVKLWIGTTVY